MEYWEKPGLIEGISMGAKPLVDKGLNAVFVRVMNGLKTSGGQREIQASLTVQS